MEVFENKSKSGVNGNLIYHKYQSTNVNSDSNDLETRRKILNKI